ncbi:MAG: hypothetical protein JOZ72_04430 [Alphaproteobacteria bacterium]|nr:hypothetical protein [Alphaproteobacteria bacterium]
MEKLSYSQRKAITVVFSIPFFFCLVNQIFKMHMLGEYDTMALVVSTAIMFIVIVYIAPSPEEIRAYKDRNRKDA